MKKYYIKGFDFLIISASSKEQAWAILKNKAISYKLGIVPTLSQIIEKS